MTGANISRTNPNSVQENLKRLRSLAKKEIAVGFPKGKAGAYPDGTSVIEVATRNNFGIGVPERDFMSLAKPNIRDKTKPILRRIAQEQDPGAVEALQNAAGLEGEAAIKNAIEALKDPPNAPATIAAKGGSDNPLIDTTHMQGAVTYVVRDK